MQDDPPVQEPERVDLAAWVEQGKANPARLIERRATEILLAAISDDEGLRGSIFLKGGVLMGVVYGSPRQTADVDFTAALKPTKEEVDRICDTLDGAFTRVANLLGHVDLRCKVQSKMLRPWKDGFEQASFPAVKLKIAYAERGSPDEKHLEAGMCSTVLEADVSFNEPVEALQIVYPFPGDSLLTVYSVYELVAEKYRALLQQENRNRVRRQDVYDLNHVLHRFDFTDREQAWIYDRLVKKSASRNIDVERQSFRAPELRKRAEREWRTLEAEVPDLPAFDPCFEKVQAFYEALPWLPSRDVDWERD